MMLAAQTCSQVCWWDRLLPEELLYSYAARVGALNALNPPKRTLEVLFGSATMIPSADLPTHLDDIFERLRTGGAFASVEDMVQRATLYPYYRFFLPEHRWDAILAHARGNDGGALKTMLGLVAGRCGATAILRSCEVCRQLALRRWGTVYWKTVLQLPGMAVCPVHGTVLVDEYLQGALSHRQQLLLPSDAVQLAASRDIFGTPLQLRLARLSQQVLHFEADPPPPEARLAAYRSALEELGMLTAQGHIRWPSLIEALAEHLGGQMPGATLVGRAGWSAPSTWAASALSQRDRFAHPLVHLVMIDFLFGSLERFLEAAGSPTTWAPPAVEAPHTWEDPQLLDASLSCRQVAELLECSVNTVMKYRSRLGISIRRRPSRVSQKLRKDIADELRTGAPVQQIARRYRVSLSTTYRILTDPSVAAARQVAGVRAKRGAYRGQWCKASRSHAGAGTKAVRCVAPAAYAWLRGHDLDWLVAHRPARSAPTAPRTPVVDWEARDKDLAKRATAAAKYGADHGGKPISATRLLSLVYNQSSARRHSDQLPRLWRQVHRLTGRGQGD